jgi:hypothetical protein
MATTRKTKFLRSAPTRARESIKATSSAIQADIDSLMSYVEHWDDERSIGNGILVTLKPGYFFYDDCGVMGFDTHKEAYTTLNDVRKRYV